MTKITKIKLRKIEVQKRLREIAGLENDQLTQQIRNEAAALSTEHSGLDVRLSALLITENDEVVEVDSESRELSRLSSRVECRRYLQAASFEGKLSGAELELNQHRKIGEQHMPWDALTPFPPEQRADVVTSAPTNVQQNQQSILGRIFARTAASFLGVEFPMVQTGESTFPVLSSGSDATQVAADTDVDAAEATFTATVLTGRSLRVRYLFNIEDSVGRFPAMEEALRADLAGALGEAMDKQILTGNGTSPNVAGFLGSGLTAPDAPTAVDGFPSFLNRIGAAVDGRHATQLMEVRTVIGKETYAKMLGLNLDANILSDYLAEKSGGLRVSALVPDATNANISQGITWAMMAPGSAVAPIWPSISLIRDPYSASKSGQVALTANQIWNALIRRPAAYQRLRFKLG